ncbi:hypothetical protein [Tolypothrix sp. VBCCA 56010]
MGNGQWQWAMAMGNGQWAMGNGQWEKEARRISLAYLDHAP